MSPTDFLNWLEGYLEGKNCGGIELYNEEVDVILKKLREAKEFKPVSVPVYRGIQPLKREGFPPLDSPKPQWRVNPDEQLRSDGTRTVDVAAGLSCDSTDQPIE